MGAFRDQVRKLWRLRLTTNGSIDLAEDAKMLASQVRHDPQFMAIFQDEVLEAEIRRIGESIAASPNGSSKVVQIGSRVSRVDALRAEVEAEASEQTHWLPVMPSVPAIKPMDLLSMTRRDVMTLANQHAASAFAYAATARFLHRVAVRMTDRDLVGDVFSEQQLAMIQLETREDQKDASYGAPRRIQ